MKNKESFIIGMWNASVVLTYAGMCAAVMGMVLAIGSKHINSAFICLMIAGVCDLFDGAVARKVKRTNEEKLYGIELDSLVDVVDFIALPIAIFVGLGMTSFFDALLFMIYAICGIARLAYFNVVAADENGPIRYYTGLPVTYVALIFPLVYLVGVWIGEATPPVTLRIAALVVSFLYILRVPIVKPKGIAYAFFALLAVVFTVVFIMVP